ncbi:hypothetical protein [Streptomyces phaeochromogenes]|uniref:hypothetical protein n=1 Tax=Streptomyces phaeochromogenes TaxID=1923 RepID=UPI002DDA8B44|nr:hypothetical protein [Streptomyces phaeochromogenes]WRZ30224.1 hypothetical protein OG931_21965 [Streptomyces phaeochromogenes]
MKPAQCFSPADMAARRTPQPAAPPAPKPAPVPAPPVETAASMAGPGTLRKNERLRSLFQRGIRISRLNVETRLTALTLLGYANFTTGLISPRFHPTDEQLSYATGLTVGQVRVQVEILRQRGWLKHRPLTQGPSAGETAMQLCVPAALLARVREQVAHDKQANATS